MVNLTITSCLTGLFASGWLYLKARSTDRALREQTLLDQAQVLSNYLITNTHGKIELHLPPRLADAYTSAESPFRYAVHNGHGQLVFTSGPRVGPLPIFTANDRAIYDYNPDGPGPQHMFGAAVETEIGDQQFYTQVEQVGQDSEYLIESVAAEFLSDGIWLQVPFLFVLLAVIVWTAKRIITPLKNVSRLADSISPNTAHIRLPTAQLPQEIVPLVAAVNFALERLEQGLQHQRDFNANAAHQLRTPLAVLMANIDNLDDSLISSRLRADVDHMSRIVSQLLLVAQLDTLSIELNDVLELNEAAADIAAGLAPYAISLSKSIELIRAPHSIFVRTNAFALRSALGNLIENGLIHTPSGTPVRLRVTEPRCIEVIDSGPGIPADQAEHIFKRFWRADKSKDGAGLGLAIVQLTMEALHGAVSVSNNPGGGAKFSLHFALDDFSQKSNRSPETSRQLQSKLAL